jgi:hypothetical protein
MRFKTFFLTCLFMSALSVLPIWAQGQQSAFKIHPIEHPGDVGCSFYLANDNKTQATVFFADTESAWINLTWHDVQHRELTLKPLGDLLTRKNEAWVTPEGIEVTLFYGRPKENEAGAFYNHIKMVLAYKGQVQTVKLKGQCGC